LREAHSPASGSSYSRQNQTLIQPIYTAYSFLEIRRLAFVLLLPRNRSLIQLMYSIFSEGNEKYSSLNSHTHGCNSISAGLKLQRNHVANVHKQIYSVRRYVLYAILRKYAVTYPGSLSHIFVPTGTQLKTVLWIRIRSALAGYLLFIKDSNKI
jgi:hypothetical protein